jgi:hypothetical protein
LLWSMSEVNLSTQLQIQLTMLQHFSAPAAADGVLACVQSIIAATVLIYELDILVSSPWDLA